MTNSIKQRQHYYSLGRKLKEEGKWNDAIDAYVKYSESLELVDKHIPFIWISDLYQKLGNTKDAIVYLKLFWEGSSITKKKEVEKMITELEMKL